MADEKLTRIAIIQAMLTPSPPTFPPTPTISLWHLSNHHLGPRRNNALTRFSQEDKCKPKKCKQECKKSCPVVRMGKQVCAMRSCWSCDQRARSRGTFPSAGESRRLTRGQCIEVEMTSKLAVIAESLCM
jgi:hypothetical protein